MNQRSLWATRLSPRRVLRILWIAAGVSFTIWLHVGFQALSVAGAAVNTDEAVVVTETDRGMQFRPRMNIRGSGLVFLPGGMVEPTAYAPLLRRIALAGHPAFLAYLPMRCGCTDAQVGELFGHMEQILAGDQDRRWIVAGHSRGGMLAARFVHEKRADLARLVLIGTTHPRDYSLAGTGVPVTKIYGSRDGVAPHAQMLENQHLLPHDTNWIEIDGGNHVQFAYYRHQLGDGDATISRHEQQQRLETALLEALSSVSRTDEGLRR